MIPKHFLKLHSLFCLLFSFILCTYSHLGMAHEEYHSEYDSPEQRLTRDLSHIVDHQLEAIRDDNLEAAYYHYTSDEFQKNTRFSEFRHFIQSIPAFSDYLTVGYGEAEEEDNKGHISVALFTENEKVPLNYTLVEENGDWKIWSINPIGTEEQETVAMMQEEMPTDSSEQQDEHQKIRSVIENHLSKIKHHEPKEVYKQHLSSEFLQTTPIEKYDEFLKEQPDLTQFHSIQIGDIKTEGKLRIVPVKLLSNQGNNRGEKELTFYLIHEDGQWKIWGLHLEKLATSPLEDKQEQQHLIEVIEHQLQALKAQDFSQAYYPYTSEEFKKAVSFDQFKEFVHEYPILTEQKNFNKIDVLTEGNLRLVRLALTSDSETKEFDYRLIKEDNQWKIWGIQVFSELQFSKSSHDKEEVKQVVKDQLQTIHSGDLSKAYYAFTAKEFQEVSSKEDFKKFMEEHPILSANPSISFIEIRFDQNMAVVRAELTSQEQKQTFLYSLAHTKEGWRIISLVFVDNAISMTDVTAEEEQKTAKTEITKAEIGTQVNLQGIVTHPATVFKADVKQITINLYVKNGKKGEDVEMMLEHEESRSQIPAIKVTLTQGGDSIINFIVTPPTQGWPIGHYKVLATPSEGEQKAFIFRIES